ncbi:MAG TPA: hypothetical protein VM554_14645 [Acidisarcina sp.]|nr:hypothetical protein [Acidisarcina sp.]
MSHSPNLLPPNASHGSADPDRNPVRDPHAGKVLWLKRVELFLRVVIRLYIGVLVLLLPWTHLWQDNHFLNYFPQMAHVATLGVVRGIVSGIGLLNLWIALSDAIQYRES